MKPSPFKSPSNRSGVPRLVAGGKLSAKAFNKLSNQVDRSRTVPSSGMKVREFQGGTVIESVERNPEASHPFQVICLGRVPAGAKKRDNPNEASPFVGKWEFFVEEGMIFGPLGMSSQAEATAGGENSWSSNAETMGDYFIRPQFARPAVVDALSMVKYLGGLTNTYESKSFLDNRNLARFYIPNTPGTYFFVLRYNRQGPDESGRTVAPFDCWAIDWETRAEFVNRGEMETWNRHGGEVWADTVIYRLPIAVVKIVAEPSEGEPPLPAGDNAGVTVRQLLRSDVFWPKNSIDIDSDGNPSDDSEGSDPGSEPIG